MQEPLFPSDDGPDGSSTSTQLFSLVQRLAGLGVWQWEVQTNVVTWSDELYRIYGLTRDGLEASFQGYLARVHPEDRERVSQTVKNALEHGDRFSFDERIVRPDGEVRVLESVGTVLRSPDGQPIRMIGACMDVTDRRALQDQLILKDRLSAMGTLAAGIAHELNNPLHYVRASLERLQELVDSGADSEAHALMRDILFGVDRMAEIVRDLNAHNRSDPPEVESISLAEIVQGAIAMVSHELHHRAQLELSLNKDVRVLASSAQLNQVVLNLLTNAVQAISPGRVSQNRVRVEIHKQAQEAVLKISDTGKGLPDGQVDRLFDPFFTTKEVGEGTGLGLFTVHRVVTSLQGTINLRPLAQGAQVEVRLPAAPMPPHAHAPDPISTATASAKRRVLIIDDNPLVGKALKRMLHDHDTVLLSSATQAMNLLSEDRSFDLVFCDLMMPDGMGHELYAHVEAQWPELAPKFRFITGGASTPEVARFISAHQDRLLRKPFSRKDALALLADIK